MVLCSFKIVLSAVQSRWTGSNLPSSCHAGVTSIKVGNSRRSEGVGRAPKDNKGRMARNTTWHVSDSAEGGLSMNVGTGYPLAEGCRGRCWVS